MTVLGTPTNQNFLGKNGFRFHIQKLPNTNFFVQHANIPAVSITPVEVGSPLVNLPYSGEHMDYNELSITFKVDEDLGAYIDLYNWMRGLSFPEDSSEYRNLFLQPRASGNGIYSDASLIILDAKKRANYELTFIDAFPVSLSEISLGYDVDDAEYLTADASFRYTLYDISRIKYAE